MNKRISRAFNRLPIKRKLIILFLLLSFFSIVATTITFLFNEFYRYTNNAREEIKAQASILAKNSSAALAFGDHNAANETLAGVKANPRILAAVIFTADKSFFASYMADGANNKRLRKELLALRDQNANNEQIFSVLTEQSKNLHLLESQPLVSEPIILDNQQIGTVIIQTDLNSLYSEMFILAGLMIAVAFVTFSIAWLVAIRFQKIISDPIISLSEIITKVTNDNNFGLRAVSSSPDEIGTLINGFNRMRQERECRALVLFEQQQLLLSEKNSSIRKLTAAVEQSANSIVITSAEGNIEYVNPNLCETTGYLAEEIMGKHLDFFSADNETAEKCRRAVFSNSKWSGELLNRKKNGESFWEQATISPVHDENGVTTNLISIKEDITERKDAELVLRQAKENAEAANRAKSSFLANMSHEIRTPMNGIIGMTDLCLNTDLSTEQRSYMNAVQFSADNLLNIINDILDFSKIEEGKIQLDNSPFLLRTAIGQALKGISTKAAEKDLEILFNPAPEVPDALIGDPGRLRQVLINLVGNAIKFTSKDEIVVSVSLAEERDDSCKLIFSVQDHGIGIPLEKQDAIFKPFEQGDLSTTKSFGGTGLGLSISKRLVSLMGGSISVVSDLGKGSTFSFTANFAIQPPFSQQIQLKPLAGLSALIVDDNAINRRVLADFLKEWGMESALAENAEQALNILSESETGRLFDFILLDVQMPEYNGWQLAKTIRQNPKLDTTFCVIMPSHGNRGDSQLCRELRINGYLIKPIVYSELYEMLCTIPGAISAEQEPASGLITRFTVLENRTRLKILVADDVAINQELISAILTRNGHIVTVANNGEEAVRLWQENRGFDIIFMDIQMPVMDGLEATGKIRELENGTGNHIPIVALTAYAMKGDIDCCLEAGMDDYISKPFKAVQVQQALQRLTTADTPPQQNTGKPEAADETKPEIQEKMTFNRSLLLERLGEEEELIPKFIQLFLKAMGENLPKLNEALASADSEAVRTISHTIKGAAANIAAEKLCSIAAEMELGGRNGELDKVGILFGQLQAEYELFRSTTGH